MKLEDLEKVLQSFQEDCDIDPDRFSWGPTFSLARDRRKEALQILKRAIKEAEDV